MKKKIDVVAIVMFLVVLAALLAMAKGFPVPHGVGFSSGG